MCLVRIKGGYFYPKIKVVPNNLAPVFKRNSIAGVCSILKRPVQGLIVLGQVHREAIWVTNNYNILGRKLTTTLVRLNCITF